MVLGVSCFLPPEWFRRARNVQAQQVAARRKQTGEATAADERLLRRALVFKAAALLVAFGLVLLGLLEKT